MRKRNVKQDIESNVTSKTWWMNNTKRSMVYMYSAYLLNKR